MKRITIYITVIFLIFVVGCSAGIENSAVNSILDSPMPGKGISIQSLEEFEEMKAMVTESDQNQLNKYLQRFNGSGIEKNDLETFVALVESIPYINLIDGKISWISYSTGTSQDTGLTHKVLYVTAKASNGDWVRLEYLLSEKDVAGKIAKESAEEKDTSLITTPIRNQDGKITLHTETREKHPSDPGDVISWVANVDGIFTRVTYYTTNASKVDTASLLGELQITGISANDAKQ